MQLDKLSELYNKGLFRHAIVPKELRNIKELIDIVEQYHNGNITMTDVTQVLVNQKKFSELDARLKHVGDG